METAIRVMVAEDDPLALRALRAYLDKAADCVLVGAVTDGSSAVELARSVKPDVAVLDIHMPILNGIEVTRKLTAPDIGCAVVCFTAFGDDETMMAALAAGASGFLLKTDSPGLVLHSIRSAYTGDSLVSPKLLANLLRRNRSASEPPVDLSENDLRLIALVGQGLSNAEIAQEVFLAPSTVKTYVSRLLTRLDRPNRTSLAILAHDWGLVS
ncbi:MAG: DNA-binding response regulator [Arachnia propionica]|nr:MAG: DNA-binding response regulator [Arachnia propionica]